MSAAPVLVNVARAVVEKRSCEYIHAETGCICLQDDEGAVILDMQSANLVAQVYDNLQDKSKFQQAINKVGAATVIAKLWEL